MFRETVLKSLLIAGACCVAITELLSLFHEPAPP